MNSAVAVDLWVLSFASQERCPVLSEDELRCAQSFSNPLMRRRYERTRSTVRKILGRRLEMAPAEIPFEKSENGKPRVAGSRRCEFSLSHSGDFLVVATATVPIGVDIETRVPQGGGLGLAKRFFSPADFAIVRAADAENVAAAFLPQWVAKEAALKALGMGIGGGLAEAECTYREGKICAVRLPATRLSIHPFTLSDGTPGAVAVPGAEEMTLRWREADELNA